MIVLTVQIQFSALHRGLSIAAVTDGESKHPVEQYAAVVLNEALHAGEAFIVEKTQRPGTVIELVQFQTLGTINHYTYHGTPP